MDSCISGNKKLRNVLEFLSSDLLVLEFAEADKLSVTELMIEQKEISHITRRITLVRLREYG